MSCIICHLASGKVVYLPAVCKLASEVIMFPGPDTVKKLQALVYLNEIIFSGGRGVNTNTVYHIKTNSGSAQLNASNTTRFFLYPTPFQTEL